MYGGAALNAMHALIADARPACCRATVGCPSRCAPGSSRRPSEELAGWARAPAGRRGARRPGRPADGPARGRGVLSPHVRRAVARRERDRGRLAAPPEDRAPGRGRGERVDPPRARARTVDEIAPAVERLLREAAPGGRRARGRAVVVRRPGARSRPTSPAIQLGSGRVRARARRRPAARSAPAARCRSCRRLARQGIPTVITRLRAARLRTSTRRTSGCWSSTCRSASPPRGSCSWRSPGFGWPTRLIDLHSHILPGVDDGPATLEEASSSRAPRCRRHPRIAATPHVRTTTRRRPTTMERLPRGAAGGDPGEGIPIDVRHRAARSRSRPARPSRRARTWSASASAATRTTCWSSSPYAAGRSRCTSGCSAS